MSDRRPLRGHVSPSSARGWWLAATLAVAVSVVTVVVAVADGKDDVGVRAASPGAIGAAADGVSSSTTVTEVTTTFPETTTTTLVVSEPPRFSGSSGTLSFEAVTTVPALSGTLTRFEVDVRDSAGGMISVSTGCDGLHEQRASSSITVQSRS